MGPGHRHSDGSPTWVPGTTAIAKLYDMNGYHDEKDGGACLVDDASASVRSDDPFSYGKVG
jgi:hypothetical protein